MILIVEDEATIRETTARFLRLEGHTVRTAADGIEALAILNKERPAVIFCDLMMPNMDGWTFRRTQLASPALATIPFVVVSAALAADGETLHAVAVFYKPVDIRELAQCAKRYDATSG